MIALVHLLRDRAEDGYRHSTLLWNIAAPYLKKGARPPAVPIDLKDQRIDE